MFIDIYVTDVYARGVNVNLTPLTSNRGALATDDRGCSLWRYLLERPPPAWESRVRDVHSALETSWDGADPGGGVTYIILHLFIYNIQYNNMNI